MSVIVGIDAGGTSVECAIEREGAISRATGTSANVRTLGATRAAQRIIETLQPQLRDAQLDAIVVGAAGAGDPALARELTSVLKQSFSDARVAVYDDAAIAFRAAVAEGDGFVLIAGTGSIAYGWFGGSTYRAGGYGPLVGDEGSGFAIGRAALALTLRVLDGRAPQDPLAETIAAQLGAGSGPDAIARIFADGDAPAAIAALATLVIERASAGDRSASKIVQAAAGDLVELVKAVVKRAGAADADVPLVFAGGLLANNSLLSYLIETRLTADLPLLEVYKNVPDAVLGALALARALARR